MRDQAKEQGSPLWTPGEMIFRVGGTGSESGRVVPIDRPFALVGQSSDSEIRLGGPGVNGRHVYLHLDPRGVYAVDLVTRSGTRFNGADQGAGWLRPGDWLEVDDRRIELVQIRIDGQVVDPSPCDDDPLSESASSPLVTVTLEARRGRNGPWTVGSELIFLGWSSACGIQVKDASVAKVHSALLRTGSAAYLVDLCGQQSRVNDRPVRGAAILDDGASITIGATPFTVRVQPASTANTPVRSGPRPLVARVIKAEVERPDVSKYLDLVSSESQHALLAWMVESIQQAQETVLQQQGEMQTTLVDVLRQMQHDNAALLKAHLERIDRIDRELAAIRGELTQRSSLPLSPPLPPLPQAIPLRIERKLAEPVDSQASTNWLLERISQLEGENRSAWKDLLGRISPLLRRTP
jgi:pSer/pThr/pTyr-binding forkhead associated (FHA) protein